jgi:hypothetical protein
LDNLIFPQNENYNISKEFSIFNNNKNLFQSEKFESLLKKLDINIENLKNLDDIKLNELEKRIEKLDILDLNKNNFCGLFMTKIVINTNKNAMGNFNSQTVKEKDNNVNPIYPSSNLNSIKSKKNKIK